MSGKHMNQKRIIISTITMILLESQLFGCSEADTQQTFNMMQESEQIELEYAVTEDDTNIGDEEQAVQQGLFWIELASLQTHPDLRTSFESQLNIVVNEDGTKNGILYTDENASINQNNTFFNAFGNINLYEFIYDEDNLAGIEDTANNEYTDIEDNQAIPAVLNAYFELLPDSQGEFNGSATLTRAQAMAMVMRAITPVNEAQKPENDQVFTAAVGDNIYTDFAAPMNEYAYINTSNGLDEQIFNSAMSRGEYVYLLTKTIFGDEYSERVANGYFTDKTQDATLGTIKDGGDITIQEAITNLDNGLPTEVYNTLAKAVALGFIDEDNLNWDDAITKSDAIQLLMDASIIYYQSTQFTTGSDGLPAPVNEEGLTAVEANRIDYEYLDELGYGNIDTWINYAKSQGADATNGAWWIYYYGGEISGNQNRSYAINQRTGEKIVAGPYTYFYGSGPEEHGASPFFGGDKTYPGDTAPEFVENMSLAMYGMPAHTNGLGEDEEYDYLNKE